MRISIADLVLSIVQNDPTLTNDQVAEAVQRQVPGATTSAASVSSVKSKAKRDGLLQAAPAATSFIPSSSPMSLSEAEADDVTPEDFEARSDRIRKRYDALERMSHRVASGGLPALIVSGPPGLGKSYTVEKTLKDQGLIDISTLTTEEVENSWEQELIEGETGERMFDILCGSISQVGLYLALWNLRKGGVLVLDDCDDVFRDETCLNLLKAVLDSSDIRRVSYRKKAAWMDEYNVPTSFEFGGSVVFCTNVDFEGAIAKGSNMASHFSALIDRSLYLSLTMRTREDFLVRLHHVAIEDGMLVRNGLSEDQADEVMVFILAHVDRFYGLSLRLVHQIAICIKADPENWQEDVRATKMRTI